MLTLLLITLLGVTPSQAITAARESMQLKNYADAVKVLQDAIPEANAIPDAKQKSMALAALHFYSAQALVGLNDEATAKQELEEFFKLSPQTSGIDAAKYDKQFVRVFQEVRSELKTEEESSFDKL